MAAPAYHANPPPFGDNPGDVFSDSNRAKSFDTYPDEKRRSGAGAVGLHLMNADFDDDDDDDTPVMHPNTERMPALAAPRPGYAAPIAALNVRQASPAPSAQMPNPFSSPPQQPRQPPAAMISRPPVAPISVPSTPHPLPPTMTPIQPVFARPEKQVPQVRFGTPILRGGGEDAAPRRGQKTDDFWRRFSMIAKEPDAHKESKWLHDTQNGKSRLSRYVWIIGLLLLACIGLAVGLGVYAHLTNKSTVQSSPKAIGGSEENSGELATSAAASHAHASSSSLHVSPTFTVERRAPLPLPTPVIGHPLHVIHLPQLSHDHRRSRRRGNRTLN